MFPLCGLWNPQKSLSYSKCHLHIGIIFFWNAIPSVLAWSIEPCNFLSWSAVWLVANVVHAPNALIFGVPKGFPPFSQPNKTSSVIEKSNLWCFKANKTFIHQSCFSPAVSAGPTGGGEASWCHCEGRWECTLWVQCVWHAHPRRHLVFPWKAYHGERDLQAGELGRRQEACSIPAGGIPRGRRALHRQCLQWERHGRGFCLPECGGWAACGFALLTTN